MKRSFKLKKVISLVMLSMILSACGNENNTNLMPDGRVVTSTSYEDMQNYFDIGEHIISIPINDDPRDNIMQYEYHPGYKPVGMAVMAYGEYSGSFGGAAITYVNIEEVIANVTGKNSVGEAVFTEFGIPTVTNDRIKEDGIFDIYEHIISIPINYNIGEEVIQFNHIDGYELVGICNSAYGPYASQNDGGCLLYVNIIPVKVEPIIDSNGSVSYASVGAPIDEKSLGLN